MKKKFGALSSSQNPQELANTVKGLVLSLSAVLLMAARAFDLPLTETDVVTLATQLGLAVGALWTLYGLGLKVVTAFAKR